VGKPKKTNAPKPTPTQNKSNKKLSYRDKAVEALKAMAAKMPRLAEKLSKLPPDVMTLDSEAVAKAFEDLAEQVAALPDDWKPTPGKRGRQPLVVEVDDIVQIREKNSDQYADLISAAADLTVTDVKEALIGVKLPGGEQVYIPRAHLKG
jgi:hypothetical protein